MHTVTSRGVTQYNNQQLTHITLEYICEEETVLLVRYIELHSARYSLLLFIDPMRDLFVYVLTKMLPTEKKLPTEALSHDCISPIKCSNWRRLTAFHQSDRARQSHDRKQNLRGSKHRRPLHLKSEETHCG